MKPNPDKHNKKVTVLAKKARNVRGKRLKIRRMEPAGLKPPVHLSQMLPSEEKTDAACSSCSAMKRNFSYEEPISSEGPETGADVPGKDKKLKGVVGDISSDLCFVSSDSSVSEDISGSTMTRLNIGSISVIGRRRAMEDSMTVAPGFIAGEYEFFAVYDGHGGARVANACRDRLHHLVEKELQSGNSNTTGELEWTKVMKSCFLKMDEEVVSLLEGENHMKEQAAERGVGSTAVVVMVGSEELVVANCGDSRAVLCRGGVAMPLSNDHKPDRPDEKERVEAAGGRIINWDGCRVQGVLATSRSIGDQYLKPYVIADPEVTVNKRTQSDEFLIIATDGLWDVVSNEVACEVVRRCLNGRISKRFSKEPGAAQAAAILAQLAIAKGSRDNISAIVVDLKKTSSKASGT
ncbi:hypothetical protein ACH5RR_038321 [Cinchona calisaya]|uniref:protein-serine/threonine phosphatase n=1 Tax=Cinchona calisaya TaxID=153742 RepID=A0ABD2XVL0_9GENT